MYSGGEAFGSRGKAGLFIILGFATMIFCFIMAFVLVDGWSAARWVWIGAGFILGFWFWGGEITSVLYDSTFRSGVDTYHNWDTFIHGTASDDAKDSHRTHRARKVGAAIADHS